MFLMTSRAGLPRMKQIADASCRGNQNTCFACVVD